MLHGKILQISSLTAPKIFNDFFLNTLINILRKLQYFRSMYTLVKRATALFMLHIVYRTFNDSITPSVVDHVHVPYRSTWTAATAGCSPAQFYLPSVIALSTRLYIMFISHSQAELYVHNYINADYCYTCILLQLMVLHTICEWLMISLFIQIFF